MENPENLRPSNPNQTVILIAEDEVVVRNVARIVLESEGYFVLCAGDGEEALKISRQYPATIHALLSDVQMPHFDGLQLRKQILIERPEIKVILMSGHIEPPADDVLFLQKPFGPAVLKKSIRQLFDIAATAQDQTTSNR
jgi:CheY-like chemotaxis protein